ncbi:AI-2E family transporter [Paraburkholderia sp.]|uniref:AI-2E family transporter n=1 Tax=Paraburkholderia sp. TaxID=1926495 RepID=UPI002399917C|nr:AI-2E family transporter [Paraburkholderia sp.]MDE1180129.1 AI-2E family transporter [Paraburkholderia sp.]
MKISLPPHGRPNRVYPPGTPGLHGLASVVTGIAVVCGLYFGRAVLVPITLSVLLSFLLAPLVNLLRRMKMGQLPPIFIAVGFALTALLGVGMLIGAQMIQLAGDLPQYQVAIERKIETVQEKTVGRADILMSRAAATLQRVAPSRPAPRPTGRAARNAPPAPTPVEVHEPAPTPLQLAQRAFSPAVAPLETTFIVLVVTIFILLQREDLRDRLISLFGSHDLHRTTTAINDAAVRLSRYFVAQLGVNLATGGVIAIGLAVIGVPGALLFGVIAALLRFVPYIGIWIAALVATILAAAIQPQWTMAVWTLVLFVVVDVAAGQVVEPLLYGHRSGLSPLAVVVAAIFWSWLWGPVGLVLSTPLTLCVVTLGRYADRLNFLTVLLGDQPALTPAQNFYQRLLADDTHEAIVQADRLLSDMPVIDYYDQVVLQGLRLARNDALRGVLGPEQLARINEALVDIIENLETVEGAADRRLAEAGAAQIVTAPPAPVHHAPFEPPVGPETEPAFADAGSKAASRSGADGESAARARARAEAVAAGASSSMLSASVSVSGSTSVDDGKGAAASGEPAASAVLCVPGRGAFDAVAASIVMQLLARQAIAATATTYERVRSGGADEADFAKASVVCVVSLDASESPPYLRNLLRRIRDRQLPATLVVGIGGQALDGAGARDAETGTANTVHPVHTATTFRALIEECGTAVIGRRAA